jgi:hypothetical protein
MSKYQTQCELEWFYSKSHAKQYIKDYIQEDVDTSLMVGLMATTLAEWLETNFESWYESKQDRWETITDNNSLMDIIEALLLTTLVQQDAPIQSIVSFASTYIEYPEDDDSYAVIRCLSEVLVVLQEYGAWNVNPAQGTKSISITSNFDCPEEITEIVKDTMYLPPIIIKPLVREGRVDHDYLTKKSDVVLNTTKAYKSGNLPLDVINKLNQQKLHLSQDFLESNEEKLDKDDMDDLAKVNQFNYMKGTSKKVYDLMLNEGNEFYLCWSMDKRGRLYPKGYHITCQGSDYKKAMLATAPQYL